MINSRFRPLRPSGVVTAVIAAAVIGIVILTGVPFMPPLMAEPDASLQTGAAGFGDGEPTVPEYTA